MQDKTTTVTNPWVTKFIERTGQDWVDRIAPGLMERHDTEDVGFALWMTRLDNRVVARVGLTYQDLEDWDYWSAYESGMDPMESAEYMLEDAGFQ